MSYRYHGRAGVDTDNPRAWATCDRCGFLYNLYMLNWQWQWQGVNMINLRWLVCETCLDKPSQFLRSITLPPDPEPLLNVRPDPNEIDE
jgi:hypothetical protein